MKGIGGEESLFNFCFPSTYPFTYFCYSLKMEVYSVLLCPTFTGLILSGTPLTLLQSTVLHGLYTGLDQIFSLYLAFGYTDTIQCYTSLDLSV